MIIGNNIAVIVIVKDFGGNVWDVKYFIGCLIKIKFIIKIVRRNDSIKK